MPPPAGEAVAGAAVGAVVVPDAGALVVPPGVGPDVAGATVVAPGEGAPVSGAGAAVVVPGVGTDVAGTGAAVTGGDVAPGVGLCELFGTWDGAVVVGPAGATVVGTMLDGRIVGGHLICFLLLPFLDLLGRPFP
jgi:hypothetical protein